MYFKAENLSELPFVAGKIIDNFPECRIFAFFGEMGAGKTSLIKAVCTHLNVSETVSSPTFALVKEYLTETEESVFHFDFYRLKRIEEAFDIGYEEYFYSGSYCLIEWPEKIEGLLPDNHIQVHITVDDKGTRIFDITENEF
ncbi:MAG: tRNA (adenosine(37)-N6)-threonylcarbamoyltransferase complex ATPase subunit type 1 TsaE [Bacteroidales bacterium]|nr:tRNA (adenosine(37)-N6)-threonylcarbamoyltransferase complex ATPase subunit type 1 TsaE [Bacteroidales bacterium]